MAPRSRIHTAGSRIRAQTRQSDVRPSRARAVLCGDAAYTYCSVAHLAARSATHVIHNAVSAPECRHQPIKRTLHALGATTEHSLPMRFDLRRRLQYDRTPCSHRRAERSDEQGASAL